MSFFLLILVVQWITGFGIMASIGTRIPRPLSIPLAPLVGMFVHTLAVFVVDLLPWGIGRVSITVAAAVMLVVAHVRWTVVKTWYRELVAAPRWTLSMADLVVIIAGAIVGYVVSWASWFWPVTPFDAMAGIDLVARQTVVDGTINNRVFTDPSLAGHLSNQPFYAPFAMLMQVIYRLLGFGYGQVWLAVTAICFSAFLYNAMRMWAHPMIAGVLWLLAILTPEMLGYTYLLQTDYLNAVFLASAVIVLTVSAERDDVQAWALAAVLFGAAAWSRTETIMVVFMGLLASIPVLWNHVERRTMWRALGLSAGAALATFVLWNGYYLPVVLPVRPDTASELTMFEFGRFVQVSGDLWSSVIVSTELWGWAFPLFALGLVGSLILNRSLRPLLPLVWIAAILLALTVVGTVFTAAVVEQTLRRGIFKLIPLMMFWLAAMPLVVGWSKRLRAWETGS